MNRLGKIWHGVKHGKLATRYRGLNKTQRRLLGAGLAVVLLLGAGWLWKTIADAHKKPPPPPAIAVDIAPASRMDFPVYQQSLGTVQALYTVTVTARVDGQLQKVAFTEGQMVKKGDLLAQIDPRPYQAAFDLAMATRDKDLASLANARVDLERYQVLAPQDFTSKQTVDTQRALVAQLEAQVKGDKATIDNAQTQLDYTSITSPIDGRTGIRLVDPGNNVHAADTTGIVVVTDMQPATVIFTLPEESLPAIQAAMARGPVEVTALSRDNQTDLGKGSIALVDNLIDQTTGTIRLKASFPNKQNTLWPGEFINIKVLVDTLHNVLVIPAAAEQRGPNGVFAYVVKPDSTVAVQDLTVGAETTSQVVVLQGLDDGTRVVTSNQYRLQAGTHIKSTPAAAPRESDHRTQ